MEGAVVAPVDDHAGPPQLEMHGLEEHVVACENSDDTDAVVADTDVAFDDYCSYHIQDADIPAVAAGDIPAPANRVAVDDTTGDDTFGVVAGIDVGDSPPQL